MLRHSYLNVSTGPGRSYSIIKQEPYSTVGTIEFGQMTDNNGYVWVPVYFSDGTVGCCTILYLQPENLNYKISPTQGYYYNVQPGDTLWDIAYLAYGDGSYYWYIMDANGLNDTTIYPGQVLYISNSLNFFIISKLSNLYWRNNYIPEHYYNPLPIGK